MYQHGQGLHQHDLLLSVAFLLGTGLGLVVWLRLRSVRWWAAWGVAAATSAAVLLLLRAPAAALTDPAAPDAPSALRSDPAAATFALDNFTPSSVEEIESLISRGGKHT